MVNGQCYWKMGKPNWKGLYHYPILSKDGDIAWRILHNSIVTPEKLHQWGRRTTPDCPWCTGIRGTLDHMFLDCPAVKNIWISATTILNKLLGPHPLQKKLILYGYPQLNDTPQQLANYLLVLAKSTIYKTYMATNSTDRPTTDYWRLFRLRLQYRMYIEMHQSHYRNEMENFQKYWMYKNILGKLQDGRIVFNQEIFDNSMDIST